MPELPEAEAVCRKLRRDAVGATIVTARALRTAVTRPQDPNLLAAECAGAVLTAVDRRGKNILLRLSNGRTLRVHLRMTGNLLVIPDVRFLNASVRAWFELEGGKGLVFEDQRLLRTIHVYPTAEIDCVDKEGAFAPLSAAFT